MNVPSEDIKDMLEADSGLGLALGDNLFVGFEPDTPNNCLTIYDTSNRGPDLAMDGATGLEYGSFQVRSRNTDYRDAWSVLNDVIASLHGRAHEVWNEASYTIRCTTSPTFLMRDDNNRAVFVADFDLERR